MDLERRLINEDLSWRRFMVLLSGLSPQSNFALTVARPRSAGRADQRRRINTNEEAASFIKSLATKKAGSE